MGPVGVFLLRKGDPLTRGDEVAGGYLSVRNFTRFFLQDGEWTWGVRPSRATAPPSRDSRGHAPPPPARGTYFG